MNLKDLKEVWQKLPKYTDEYQECDIMDINRVLDNLFKEPWWIVTYVYLGENEIYTECIQSFDPLEAVKKHSKITGFDWEKMPKNIPDLEQYFWDSDCLLKVKELF